ncbi:hypothetical protein ACTFIU_007898 [Dictyostelium citrinum]
MTVLLNFKYDFNIYIDNNICGTSFQPDLNKIKELAELSSFGKGEFLISSSQSFDRSTIENKIYAIKNNNKSTIDFNWIGFYNACIHKVSGTRVILQFNIHLSKNRNIHNTRFI